MVRIDLEAATISRKAIGSPDLPGSLSLTVRFKGRNMLNGYCALNFLEPPLAHRGGNGPSRGLKKVRPLDVFRHAHQRCFRCVQIARGIYGNAFALAPPGVSGCGAGMKIVTLPSLRLPIRMPFSQPG